ncbi:MAG: hypothetical protein FWC80_00425 [Firmicutes bacterium]|nr:hypothetical protein [Bacillota bacterium]
MLDGFLDDLAGLLFGWFFDLLYNLQMSIFVIVDFIVETFNMLAGIDTVTVDGRQTDILSHFLESNAVRTAFFGVMLIGMILLCIFVIIAIIRSEYADAQHKKTKAQILAKAGQSLLIFLLIPFLLASGIVLTNVIMSAVNSSMLMNASGGERALFGGQVLVTAGHNAFIGPAGRRVEIEQMFITGALCYRDLSVVRRYYDLSNVNFVIGISSGVILLVLFALAALRFIQRIFDIILLYIVSPVSVSTIPVDDGARFKLWREMLISKVLSAYGIILAMNLFFLIIPQMIRIQFFDSGFQNGLIGLLFMIGGAFAVTKAYMVIAQLTGTNAGAQEAQQTLSGIYFGARSVRGVARFGMGAAGQVIGGADFRRNLRRGVGFGDNVGASVKGNRNQRNLDSADGKNKGTGNMDEKQSGENKKEMNALLGKKKPENNSQEQKQSGKPNKDKGQQSQVVKNTNESNVNNAVNSQGQATSEKETSEGGEKGNKALRTLGGASRLASMPVGVIKDAWQGGAITTVKNIWPRIKNIATGRGIINHADITRKEDSKK